MAPTRYAFVKACWHADIVDKALDGFCEIIPSQRGRCIQGPRGIRTAVAVPRPRRHGSLRRRRGGRIRRRRRDLSSRIRRPGGRGRAHARRNGNGGAGSFGFPHAPSLSGDRTSPADFPHTFRREGTRSGPGGSDDRQVARFGGSMNIRGMAPARHPSRWSRPGSRTVREGGGGQACIGAPQALCSRHSTHGLGCASGRNPGPTSGGEGPMSHRRRSVEANRKGKRRGSA